MNFKKGYMVARKSYGKDIIFVIEKIVKKNRKKEYAILNGLTIRIKADAPIEDLEIVSKQEVEKKLKEFEEIIKKRAEQLKIVDGKILKRYREIINTPTNIFDFMRLALNQIELNSKN